MKSAPQRRIDDLLREAQDTGASDVHLAPDRPPYFRYDGQLKPAAPAPLTADESTSLIEQLLQRNDTAREHVQKNHQADFSYALPDNSRFRVNVFSRLGALAATLRVIPGSIRSLEELNLPASLLRFTELKQGFVLTVGPAGHGKSTTLAALLNYVNSQRCEHIITIEDPIEYQFIDNKAIIDQREVGRDTTSFPEAIRAALRQDPNIVLIGELRDYESMRAALTLAETGHLVFSSLHTNDAGQTVERIIDSFPPAQQSQVRSQLSATLSGVISQRLLPGRQGGRLPAVEIMIASTAIRAVIRENKVHQIVGIIETSGDAGMQTLDASLQALIDTGSVAPEAALPWLKLNEGVGARP